MADFDACPFCNGRLVIATVENTMMLAEREREAGGWIFICVDCHHETVFSDATIQMLVDTVATS